MTLFYSLHFVFVLFTYIFYVQPLEEALPFIEGIPSRTVDLVAMGQLTG